MDHNFNERQQFLLAVGIVEWGHAVTQLFLLGERGDEWNRVVGELHHLIKQWPGTSPVVTPNVAERVIAEAAAFISDREEKLDTNTGTPWWWKPVG